MMLKTEKNTIYLGKKKIVLTIEIMCAYKIFNKIIVLYNYMETKHNLVCIDLNGKLRWEAELATNEEMEGYCYVLKYWPNIVANSWSNNECVIDSKTGKILSKKFTKT